MTIECHHTRRKGDCPHPATCERLGNCLWSPTFEFETTPRTSDNPPIRHVGTQWEYTLVEFKQDKLEGGMNALGRVGWEAWYVEFRQNNLYRIHFKRPR